MRFIKSLRLALAIPVLAMATTVAYGTFGIVGSVQVHAQTAKQQVCEGVNAGGGCTAGGGQITNVIEVAVNILSIVAGIVAVIMIILAGLRYVTSGGDATKVAGAKAAIIYAIVGLVVVALSQIIVNFVLVNATKP